MMLEDIEKEWAKDVVLDPLRLDRESLNIPKLHSKYWNILVNEKLVMLKLKNKLENREYILEQFFNKTLTTEELQEHKLPIVQDKKVMKTDIPKAIANTPDIIDTKTKIGVQHVKIDFIDSILKQVQNRNWVIRDAIEWRKFENGA